MLKINDMARLEKEFPFQKLEVWHDAKELSLIIYQITRSISSNEKFGLISQMRRAAISVPANLAEGSSRITKKEQARFTEIAFGSLMELANLLIIAQELKFVDSKAVDPVLDNIKMLGKRLSSLRNSQFKAND
ncbi:four helix bundle protein [Cytophagales bacterium EPR-FJ-38]